MFHWHNSEDICGGCIYVFILQEKWENLFQEEWVEVSVMRSHPINEEFHHVHPQQKILSLNTINMKKFSSYKENKLKLKMINICWIEKKKHQNIRKPPRNVISLTPPPQPPLTVSNLVLRGSSRSISYLIISSYYNNEKQFQSNKWMNILSHSLFFLDLKVLHINLAKVCEGHKKLLRIERIPTNSARFVCTTIS
jgi:hypothetical protein